MEPNVTELIARASWREAITYRDTWPHEYVLTQQEVLEMICQKFRAGDGMARRFFSTNKAFLFTGDHNYGPKKENPSGAPSNERGDRRCREPRCRRTRPSTRLSTWAQKHSRYT